jgi:hypothetical protein
MQPFCEEPKTDSYVKVVDVRDPLTGNWTKESHMHKCPLTGLTQQFSCSGEGVLKYVTTGFWHDGLELEEASTTAIAPSGEPPRITFRTIPSPEYNITDDTKFYRCPSPNSCSVDERSGSVTCAPGSEGILCSKCSSGYYRNRFAAEYEYGCNKCPDDPALAVLLPLFLLLACLLLLGYCWVRWGSHVWHVWWDQKWEHTFHKRPLHLVIIFKIVLGLACVNIVL